MLLRVAALLGAAIGGATATSPALVASRASLQQARAQHHLRVHRKRLEHVRFGKDQAELTTRAYAGHVALYLRRRIRTGRDCRGRPRNWGRSSFG